MTNGVFSLNKQIKTENPNYMDYYMIVEMTKLNEIESFSITRFETAADCTNNSTQNTLAEENYACVCTDPD